LGKKRLTALTPAYVRLMLARTAAARSTGRKKPDDRPGGGCCARPPSRIVVVSVPAAVAIVVVSVPAAEGWTAAPSRCPPTRTSSSTRWRPLRVTNSGAELVSRQRRLMVGWQAPADPALLGDRWAVDRQLRDAVCGFAGDSRPANAWPAELYRHARAWIHIIWKCWITNTPAGGCFDVLGRWRTAAATTYDYAETGRRGAGSIARFWTVP